MSLGWHWIATAAGCAPERLHDADRAVAALQRLTELLQLTPVSGPVARRTDSGGLVAMVLLAESHASIHVDGETLFTDVFSCREFDPELCETWLAEAYGATSVDARMLERAR